MCNKKAQICCLISMETTIFATVLRFSEVSLHILVQRERVCLFHVLRWVCPDSRYGWRLNVLPMFWLWTVQVERFHRFVCFALNMCIFTYYFHLVIGIWKRTLRYILYSSLVYDSQWPIWTLIHSIYSRLSLACIIHRSFLISDL